MTPDPLMQRFPQSATARLFGQRVIEFDTASGWVRMSFVATDAFLNPAGSVQGGILGAMLDDTMGPALWLMNGAGAFSATIDLNVSFLAAAAPGLLYGEGKVVQLGKTISFLEAQLSDPEGRVIARSTASARMIRAAG
jgi:uncharacterized protein (TIGR00369 family)